MYAKTEYVGMAYHFSLIPAAYACVPPPVQQSNEVIEKIEIITHQDFDSTHLAGSNVTDLFVDSWNQNSIQEALENDPYFYLSQSFKYYVLTTSPTTTKSYDFTVKYNFTNGKVLETTIDKVVIKSQK